MKKYIVLLKDCESVEAIVIASSKKEARKVFADNMSLDWIRSELYGNDEFVPELFFWRFVLATKSEQCAYIENNREIIATNDIVQKRVYDYFEGNIVFADLMIEYLEMPINYYGDVIYPEEMIRFITKKEFLSHEKDSYAFIEMGKIPVYE